MEIKGLWSRNLDLLHFTALQFGNTISEASAYPAFTLMQIQENELGNIPDDRLLDSSQGLNITILF